MNLELKKKKLECKVFQLHETIIVIFNLLKCCQLEIMTEIMFLDIKIQIVDLSFLHVCLHFTLNSSFYVQAYSSN